MKKQHLLILLFLMGFGAMAQEAPINLLVRADDMGAARSVNFAAIESYEKGIVRSVEVIVPGPWFEEAAVLLRDRPDLDVGIHLTLTSEWSGIKWRPITHCPSITDADGYFFPFVWKNDKSPESPYITGASWDIGEIERELRAQIELGMKRIPQVTHLSEHMGCLGFSEEAKQLLDKLAAEYNLSVDLSRVSRFPRWSGSEMTASMKVENLRAQLEQLPAGDYLLVEHPAYDDLETQGLGHVGYENVAEDRTGVLQAFTDPKVKDIIAKRGIHLKSYRDFAKRSQANARPPVSWMNPGIPKMDGLSHHVLHSKAMGHDVGFVVWTPTAYKKGTDQRFPVVYFLHGMGGTEISDAAGFSSRVAQAIERGDIPPVICVFPNGGRSGYRGNVEQMIVSELIPHIDAEYRTISDAESRALVGFSMGGAGAVYLATVYPERFKVAASLGGGIRLENGELKDRVETALPVWKQRGFGFYLVNGDKDRPEAFREFAKMLASAGVDHRVRLLDDTGHNLGHYFDRSLAELLVFVGGHLDF
ncbi:ChbG/HpnK family deacetylase [Parapedobacter indicus]|uniref:Predicted glycoside hydrolase or deacetylase ChbG, UPF0249 family n=1 Tax=Parapedobacter indicus TaxID=1477437 RepID=A0A1I3FBG9_9SPHI|nr:ChbG/HpnK family deacetylase [Parapedobacter indicus]PPL03644.1 putative glycoside hydrolase/deacetylase ChbG (UPF0249 family) [Parapedobacter indicus]SFI08583.1 Predicted glycoside hydrolase or deacetylase ChbG, UPF0249 family [Parapedobacter indicus]